MNELYPIKFKPIFKEKVWGGGRLNKVLSKNVSSNKQIGESWELSGLAGNVSEVANGFLAGNSLNEILEVYMSDFVGEIVFNKFGTNFPLLLKFIDANDVLSVQVHPDDKLAKAKHKSYGKTELWYIVDALPDAYIYNGFNKDISKNKLSEYIEKGTVSQILNKELVQNGDSFFIPAGRIHATGPGVLFAEIQQSSDITYRVYDWNRMGLNGKLRDLHVNEALLALDFEQPRQIRNSYDNKIGKSNKIEENSFFIVNKLILNSSYFAEYNEVDSFVAYMCLKGEAVLGCDNGSKETIEVGETVLIPAAIENVKIIPKGEFELLEIYLPVTNN